MTKALTKTEFDSPAWTLASSSRAGESGSSTPSESTDTIVPGARYRITSRPCNSRGSADGNLIVEE